MLCEFGLSSTSTHCFDTVSDQSIGVHTTERLKVTFQVGLGRLTLVADGVCDVLEVVARGACLEQMCASLVNAGHEKSHTIWALVRVARFCLRLAADSLDKSLAWMLRAINVRIVQTRVAHTDTHIHSNDLID